MDFNLLRCPNCGFHPIILSGVAATCDHCGAIHAYDATRHVVSLAPRGDLAKEKIRTFWGDLALQWYANNDQTLTRASLADQLDAVEAFFRHRGQLAVVEMPIETLRGKRVLEVGSGGGAHSALFKRKGASMVSLDITPERVLSTALKLNLVDGPASLAVEGDAENLPFVDGAFDIVYSNGVLHHSANTERCISEVHRVLKPGGQAVLMLYARHSTQYWLNIFPKMLLTGSLFTLPEAEAIGRITEGRPRFRTEKNPYTRVYSKQGVERLLKEFSVSSVRKSSFRLDYFAIPKAAALRRAILGAFGAKATVAGPILYGERTIPDCGLELLLSPLAGWCLNISAVKAHESPQPIGQ